MGAITVVEGLSKSASSMVSYLPMLGSKGRITQHQVVMIVASIPLHDLCVIFWNIVRDIGQADIKVECFYRNLSGYHVNEGNELNYNSGKPVVVPENLIGIEVMHY